MRKLLLIMTAWGLLCLPAAAWAEETGKDQAEAAKVAENSPAEVEYSKAMAELRKRIKEARQAVGAGNSALAVGLGKTDAYDEEEIKVPYAQLTKAQEKLAELELEAILLYKKHHPNWKPDAGGKKVRPGGRKKSPKRPKQPKADD